MNWTRVQLKSAAKDAIGRNYWSSVLCGFVSMLVAGGTVSVSYNLNQRDLQAMFRGSLFTLLPLLMQILFVASLASVAISIFLRNPLKVGVSRFFLCNASANASPREMGYAFSENRYWKTVGAMALRMLYVFLFSLLLVVPGIMRAYDYYLVPQILADNPNMSASEALAKSKQLMYGHRFDTFVLNLSFLGWAILSALTMGILNIFYLTPYMLQTDTALYLALRGLPQQQQPW